MRQSCFLLLFLLVTLKGHSQNLFPNPGFEQYLQCPTYTSQIERATGWDSCLGTADFYHCGYYAPSTLGPYGIPATGSGCVGLAASVPGSWTQPPGKFYGETFRGNLLQVLEPGATYELKADMYYNTVSFPPPGPCLEVGFYFFKTTNPPVYPPNIPYHNQYRAHASVMGNLIPVSTYGTFTMNWVADSCYDAVMIGVFSVDSTFGVTCAATASNYYFDIDNISMRKIADAPLRSTTLTVSDNSICENDCVDFTANSNFPVYTYQWEFPGSNTGTSSAKDPAGICYPLKGDFTPSLITTYECGSDTLSLSNINVEAVPQIQIVQDSAALCFGESILLNAISGAAITWNTGANGPSLAVNAKGVYIATASNQCGTASDSIRVDLENCPCELFLPNAFSPDNDGLNDEFAAQSDCILKDFQLEVYNRWGQLVFRTTDIHSGWDGRFNGEVCPQGVYAVRLKWEGYRDERVVRVNEGGYVVVMR